MKQVSAPGWGLATLVPHIPHMCPASGGGMSLALALAGLSRCPLSRHSAHWCATERGGAGGHGHPAGCHLGTATC